MIKIGDFSRISRVPVKTLRYYDEVGLLKPVEVDRFTGYRYYSLDQLSRLNRILALKDLGFSLEQIAQLLDENLPAAQIRGMLRMKQAELQDRVREEQERLARVEARLRQIEQEGSFSHRGGKLRSDAGVVILKGEVPSLTASAKASELARQIPGVRAVKNELTYSDKAAERARGKSSMSGTPR